MLQEFVIGACRAMVPVPSMPSSLLLADRTTRLGQELFEPPHRTVTGRSRCHRVHAQRPLKNVACMFWLTLVGAGIIVS
jgi:hypothetical protein